MHHGVEITDPAIVAAATLSHRYIADRQLPDKAIDLIDEAASRIRMEIDSKPEEMDRLDRRIIQLKIEREALKKESDEASKKRLAALDEQLRGLEKEYADLEEIWKAEKATRAGRGAASRRSSSARGSNSRRRAAPATSRACPSCSTAGSPSSRSASRPRRPRSARRRRWCATRSPTRRSPRSSPSGPASRSSKMLEGERDKLLRMEEALGKRVVGQDEAVTRRRRRDPPLARRPLGPEPPERLVPVPRAHRRRQDRAVARRSPSSSSTPRRPWCASTCRSSWRSTPWRG